MRIEGTFFRGHDPRWSWAPLSGEGARLHGGRWNPAGTAALYLASTVEGILAEMSHGFGNRMNPLTLVQYDVDCSDIVDLTDPETRTARGITLQDMQSAWHRLKVDTRIPPTWTIASTLIAAGYAGILVPSFAPSARPEHRNLVLWQWGEELPHQVKIFDPDSRLPRDGSSWQTG